MLDPSIRVQKSGRQLMGRQLLGCALPGLVHTYKPNTNKLDRLYITLYSMEVLQSCRCCLRRLADKDLTTPYIHLGKTEIYADMLKQCFNLNLWVSSSMFSGICSPCVGRLRDASDFKLQVQRSQIELLERLQCPNVKDEEPSKKTEMTDEEGSDADKLLAMKNPEAERTQWAYSVQLERLLDVPLTNYACHDCGKHFQIKKALTRHIRFNCPTGGLAAYNKKHRKADKNLMDCSYCSYRSKNDRNLYFHIMKHVGEKPYQCDICDYKTGRKADFDRHHSVHSGIKPFKCKYCEYSCIQKHTLLIHMRIHTGEKPYACSNCDSRFTRVQCLTKHLKRHIQCSDKSSQNNRNTAKED